MPFAGNDSFVVADSLSKRPMGDLLSVDGRSASRHRVHQGSGSLQGSMNGSVSSSAGGLVDVTRRPVSNNGRSELSSIEDSTPATALGRVRLPSLAAGTYSHSRRGSDPGFMIDMTSSGPSGLVVGASTIQHLERGRSPSASASSLDDGDC